MIPRSAAEGQKVNSRKADEVFGEHGGWRQLQPPRPTSGSSIDVRVVGILQFGEREADLVAEESAVVGR